MLIDFNAMEEVAIPGMNGGTGTMSARMYADAELRFVRCAIHPGGSIGLHTHDKGDDINYVLSGTGIATCDGVEEQLAPGVCHVCRKGSSHSIANTGPDDLVLFTAVVAR